MVLHVVLAILIKLIIWCVYVFTILPWDINTLCFLRTVLGFGLNGQFAFNRLSYSSFIVLF